MLLRLLLRSHTCIRGLTFMSFSFVPVALHDHAVSVLQRNVLASEASLIVTAVLALVLTSKLLATHAQFLLFLTIKQRMTFVIEKTWGSRFVRWGRSYA